MVYAPSARVVALRVTPVALFVALTVAASRGTPAESRTTPVMRPLGVCARAGAKAGRLSRIVAIATTLEHRRTRQSMIASCRWICPYRDSHAPLLCPGILGLSMMDRG